MNRYLLAMLLGGSVLLAGAVSFAGAQFHLEIGPPIAAGTATRAKPVLVVRPLCCDPATVRMTATAEGLVGGTRRSIALDLEALPTPGVHALPRQWPDGQWVVHLAGTCAERQTTASAIVPLTTTGFDRATIQVLTRAATADEIDSALRRAPVLASVSR